MRFFFLAASVALVGCGSTSAGPSPSSDDSGAPNDASAIAFDASPDAVADASSDAACAPAIVDAGIADGEILGLPTVEVPVAPPVPTPQVAATPPSDHYPKQVAVLNLSADIKDAQAVAHVLAPMGLPYAITTSPVLAIQHDMAVFFPEANNGSFDATATNLLQQWVQGGGVVVMKYSDVAMLKQLGGVASSEFHLEHHFVTLTDQGKARFPSLDRAEEQKIPLGGDPGAYLNTWTVEVDPQATGVTVLATFDDGKPAIVERQVGTGFVYTLGVDYRDVVLRNQLGHAISAARGYVNLFEPATDTWMLMLRDLYDAHVRFGVRLHTAPSGQRAAVLLSHDLDWGPSYDNAVQYAMDEMGYGASATYFIHTKYVSDQQDVAFFGPEREAQLATIAAAGGRIGSHTVAHSPVLHTFPIGDGTEAYPAYAPYNASLTQTDRATLFGELRVSKSLIDGALAARCVPHEVTTFRAGNLDYHAAAPQTMERLGYRFDSTRAVGDVLASFPFRAMTDWPDALDTSVFELPVVIEDQLAPRFDVRVAQSLAIIGANADNGAPTTVLVHPNVLDYKENGQRAIVQGLPPGVRAMSIDEFAAFWRARDAVRITKINYDDSAKTVTIVLSAPEAIEGLTLRVDASVKTVLAPSQATLTAGKNGNFVVLPSMPAGGSLTVTLGY